MKGILQKNSIEAEMEAKLAAQAYWKRLKYIGLTAVILTVAGLLGYSLLWPKIRVWRENRSLAEAEGYEKKGDYRRALLILEQTIQLYPGNLEAKRRLANFLERLGQRQALDVWKELSLAAPQDPRHLIGLAGAALRFGELKTAREALNRVRESGRVGAEYYRLNAGLALVTHDNVALEAALAELTKADPKDLRVQLNLAVVRLHADDPRKEEAGRAALMELVRSDTMRIRAIVELLNSLARRWPQPSPERTEAFRALARELTPPRGPRLEPPQLADPVERLLAFAMRQPNPEPEDAGVLLSWLILNGRASAGFTWMEMLPPATRNSPLVAATASEAALQIQDWPHLRQLLLAGAWGPFPPGAVTAAFALHEDRRVGAKIDPAQWTAIVDACQSSLPALRALLRLSEAWRWPEEQRQVLTAITRTFAAEAWAWRQLIAAALARGDADQVWQIYQRWSRAVPGDPTVQIETAIMGQLLQQRGAPGVSQTGELMRAHADSPGAAVAHALALWRAQRLDEGLAVLAPLPAAVFAEPRYALAYGLMLAEAGRARESERMLDRASLDRMLPAERLLIEQARARNRQRLGSGRKT